MGWYLRKSVRVGPVRFNFSKRGVGMSTGVKGFRVGTGPRGPYVAGGRGGLYFRRPLSGNRKRGRSVPRGAAHLAAGAPSANTDRQAVPLAQSSDMPAPRHVYGKTSLIAMWAACALAAILFFTDPGLYTTGAQLGFTGSLGVAISFCLVVYVCVVDWRGATSLNGFIKWRRLNGWQRFLVGYLLLGLSPFLVTVYLVQASQTYREAQHEAPLDYQRQVAQLEADLGIMPATSGACRKCGKPMQVGADFCAYCGTPAVEKPLICPNCATTTLPDAKFCPKCGAALPPD